MFENKYTAVSVRNSTLIISFSRVPQGLFVPASETNVFYKRKAKMFSDLVSSGAQIPRVCYASQPV